MLGVLWRPGQLLAVLLLVLQLPGTLEFYCPVPTIAHGQLKPAENFTYGSKATLECDPGYVPVASTTTLLCLGSGIWHPRVPACTLGRCPPPPSVEQAERSPQRAFPVGTVVTYSCRAGFTLLPDVSPTTTCLQNFTWSAVPKLCQQVQCPSPVIHYGGETPGSRRAEYTLGHQVEVQCDPGYVLRGNSRSQCSADGVWRPALPYCDKVCGPPPEISKGQHSGLRAQRFHYGSEVKYSCAEGLSLIGEESIYCTSHDGLNMVWSAPAPECRVVRCARPVVPRGTMTPQRFTFTYLTTVSFSCEEGFVLHGNAESQCQADSSWHPPLPTCQPAVCPQPEVANGRLRSTLAGTSWYQRNATVTFECLPGYHFSGDAATCLPDGTWTPLPKCRKESDADICKEADDIRAALECGVPAAEVKTLLEIQKLFLEIKKLKVELEGLKK